MLDKDTKQRINSARQILVGKVPDPKAQVEQITNALIYKFMDQKFTNSKSHWRQAVIRFKRADCLSILVSVK